MNNSLRELIRMNDEGRLKNRMILFMGKSHEHAPPSFQKFIPDQVHIITSDIFRKEHMRRLNTWSKKYGFTKGKVKSVDDLFEESSINSLMKCVFELVEHSNQEKPPGSISNWYIGLTGGTMHMAASATLAGSLIGARLFYVIKPGEGQSVMANKHVFEFPTLGAIGLSLKVATKDLIYLRTKEKGDFEHFKENCDIPSYFFELMREKGLVTIGEKGWEVTLLGKRCFEVVLSSAISGELFELRKSLNDRKSKSESNGTMWV